MQYQSALTRETRQSIGIRPFVSRIVAQWILSLLMATWPKGAGTKKKGGWHGEVAAGSSKTPIDACADLGQGEPIWRKPRSSSAMSYREYAWPCQLSGRN